MKPLALLLSAALLAGCPETTPDPVVDAAPSAPAWQTTVSKLDGALLSVWGTGSDVFAAGGSRGNGFDSLVVRFDGTKWTRLAAGGKETFWWVHGTSASDVWLAGENGRITHWDGSKFEEQQRLAPEATLFGIFAFAKNDVWAVGGTPEGGTAKENDVILHYDGAAWTRETLPGQKLGRAHFKVWGASPDDLYVVGEAGVIWHRSAGTWTKETSPARGTLLTVFGCSATDVYAVGSRDVLKSDGKTWSRVDVMLTNDVNGVTCAKPGEVAIVGFGGSKQRLVDGKWIDEFDSAPHNDLHGVYIDKEGAVWAAGGNFINPPVPGIRRDGLVARWGKGTVPSTITP
jgi:hypothetical protein